MPVFPLTKHSTLQPHIHGFKSEVGQLANATNSLFKKKVVDNKEFEVMMEMLRFGIKLPAHILGGTYTRYSVHVHYTQYFLITYYMYHCVHYIYKLYYTLYCIYCLGRHDCPSLCYATDPGGQPKHGRGPWGGRATPTLPGTAGASMGSVTEPSAQIGLLGPSSGLGWKVFARALCSVAS